ncbi:hypothetical protein EVAR_55447_1 [Eumeta japonica]|uniref:Uncharacterized protein n=1 Tax=Eumeta variegata TaxID=151549 RepID=A0A4C1Y6E8_EUMVA|nr:hypothetical protein EVAR_55447_1 [Eumeta japonica]
MGKDHPMRKSSRCLPFWEIGAKVTESSQPLAPGHLRYRFGREGCTRNTLYKPNNQNRHKRGTAKQKILMYISADKYGRGSIEGKMFLCELSYAHVGRSVCLLEHVAPSTPTNVATRVTTVMASFERITYSLAGESSPANRRETFPAKFPKPTEREGDRNKQRGDTEEFAASGGGPLT